MLESWFRVQGPRVEGFRCLGFAVLEFGFQDLGFSLGVEASRIRNR